MSLAVPSVSKLETIIFTLYRRYDPLCYLTCDTYGEPGKNTSERRPWPQAQVRSKVHSKSLHSLQRPLPLIFLNIISPLISISPLKGSNQLHAFYGAWGFTLGGFKKKKETTTDIQKSHFTDAFRTIKPHIAQHYSTGQWLCQGLFPLCGQNHRVS